MSKPTSKVALGPRSKPTDFHPCPGSAPQGAWINMLLSDGDGMDFDADVTLTLKQWEIHNLIVTLYHAAKKVGIDGHSGQTYMQTAEKLEKHWQASLRRQWVDRR